MYIIVKFIEAQSIPIYAFAYFYAIYITLLNYII